MLHCVQAHCLIKETSNYCRQFIKGQLCNHSHIFILHLIIIWSLVRSQETQVLTGLIRRPALRRFLNCRHKAWAANTLSSSVPYDGTPPWSKRTSLDGSPPPRNSSERGLFFGLPWENNPAGGLGHLGALTFSEYASRASSWVHAWVVLGDLWLKSFILNPS